MVLCGGCVRTTEETLLCALDSEGRCNLFDVIDQQEGDLTSGGEHDGSYVVRLTFLCCHMYLCDFIVALNYELSLGKI